ncbi:B12-binding domain-containing radical SAM protein [Candidatus Sumerlaeota bacterium]|nr:B12-binding domain-containing radical SAM protein [Candidatus Sumerlaeota bacterium]
MRVAMYCAHLAGRPYQQSLPPLGLGYLIAYTKGRCPSVEFIFCHSEQEVLASKADVVAISSASENFGDAQRVAASARESLDATIIIGGNHITALPHRLPRCFDIAVLGEGETTFLELIQMLAATRRHAPSDLAKIAGICFRADPPEADKVVTTAERPQIRDLDSLPYPDRDALGDRWKVPYSRAVHLIASRGCPYKCAFCASGRLWKGYRVFSADYVAREIEHIRSRYNPREIHFFDDLFLGHRARLEQFCRLADERGLHRGVLLRTHARADAINEEVADMLARYNFHYIDFGIESNNQQTLEYLGKHGITPEINQRAIDLLAGRGLSVGVSIIIGSPSETREQIEETYAFLEHNRPRIDRLSVGLLVPLPGTPVWDEAVRRDLVSEGMEWERLGIDSDSGEIGDAVILSEHLDRAEMAAIFRRFITLAHIVNARGQVRDLTDECGTLRGENEWLAGENKQLRQELDTLKGSRAVRLALRVRDIAARFRRPTH